MAEEDRELAALQHKLDSELNKQVPDQRPAIVKTLVGLAGFIIFMLMLGASCDALSNCLGGKVHP